MKKSMLKVIMVLAAGMALAAGATQYTWKGGTGTVDGWNTSSNWEPAGVPNAGDTAVFNNSVNISSAINIGEGVLTISVPSTGSTTTYTVTFSGVISGAGGIDSSPANWSNSGSRNNVVQFTGTQSTFTGQFRVVGKGQTKVTKLANLGANSSIGHGTAGVPVCINAGFFYVTSTCSTDRPFYLPSTYSQLYQSSGTTTTFTGEITGERINCRDYGNFKFESAIPSTVTYVGRTDGGILEFVNAENAFTANNITVSAGDLRYHTAADCGELCSLGTGDTIIVGQGNGTSAQFTYAGDDDAEMDRTIKLRFWTDSTAANYTSYYKAIQNRTSGTTLTLNGSILNDTPAAEYALLKIGGNGDMVMNTPLPSGVYVTKIGGGTVTLNADSAQTKATTVSAGHLDVAATIPAASEVMVSGGVLGGTGTVHGATTIATGGMLTAGTAAECGALTFDAAANPLTFGDGAIIMVKVDAAHGTNDVIVVDGDVTVNGIVTIRLQDIAGGGIPNGTYKVMTCSSAPLASFVLGDGLSGSVNVGADGVSVTVAGGAMTWSGNAANNVWDFSTANWNGSLFTDGESVSFPDSGVSSVPVRIVSDVAPADVAFLGTASTYTIEGAKITGTCGLSKTGAGSLVINNTNDFTGATMLQDGSTTLNGKISGTSISVRGAAAFHESPTGVIAGEGINLAFGHGDVLLEGTNTFTGRVRFDLSGYNGSATKYVRLAHNHVLGNAESLAICPNSEGKTALSILDSVTIEGKTLFLERGAGSYKFLVAANDGVISSKRFEWAGDVKVADGVGGAPWVEFQASAGSTLHLGTVNTTEISGLASMTLRGSSAIYVKGRISTSGEVASNDVGTKALMSTNNSCSAWLLYQGVLRTDVDYAFAKDADCRIGKSISGYYTHDVTLNLNGTTQQVARLLEIGLDENASGTRRITGDAPSTLIVKGDSLASSYGSVTVCKDNVVREGRIIGGVSIVKDGLARFDLNASTNLFTGDVTVKGGVLAANAPFSLGLGRGLGANPASGEGDKLIEVTGGTLQLNAAQEGLTNAVFSVGAKDGTAGVIQIAEGVVQRARYLKIDGELRSPGVYGGAASAAPRRLGCFAGSGLLVVDRGVSGGVVIFR